MITILVVSPPRAELGPLAGADSSRELLFAGGPEEAVEKLARNRRVDAVLLLSCPEAARVVEAIREELSPPPPLFAPSSAGLAFVTALPEGSAESLLEGVARALEA
jgi:hypothetical protein